MTKYQGAGGVKPCPEGDITCFELSHKVNYQLAFETEGGKGWQDHCEPLQGKG